MVQTKRFWSLLDYIIIDIILVPVTFCNPSNKLSNLVGKLFSNKLEHNLSLVKNRI